MKSCPFDSSIALTALSLWHFVKNVVCLFCIKPYFVSFNNKILFFYLLTKYKVSLGFLTSYIYVLTSGGRGGSRLGVTFGGAFMKHCHNVWTFRDYGPGFLGCIIFCFFLRQHMHLIFPTLKHTHFTLSCYNLRSLDPYSFCFNLK